MPAIFLSLVVIVAQGAIGYTQYEMGIPPWLVALHIADPLIGRGEIRFQCFVPRCVPRQPA